MLILACDYYLTGMWLVVTVGGSHSYQSVGVPKQEKSPPLSTLAVFPSSLLLSEAQQMVQEKCQC